MLCLLGFRATTATRAKIVTSHVTGRPLDMETADRL